MEIVSGGVLARSGVSLIRLCHYLASVTHKEEQETGRMMDTELGDEYEELRMVGCEKSPPANRKLCWDKLQCCILAIESK